MGDILFLIAKDFDTAHNYSLLSKELERRGINTVHLAWDAIDNFFYEKVNIKPIKVYKNYSEVNKDEYNTINNEYDLEKIIKYEYKLSKYNNVEVDKKIFKKKAAFTIKVLSNLNKSVKFNKIIMWGESYIYERAAKQYGLKNNKEMRFLENGYFRPFTITWDKSGVNYNNSLPRDKEFYKKLETKSLKKEQFFKPLKVSRATLQTKKNFITKLMIYLKEFNLPFISNKEFKEKNFKILKNKINKFIARRTKKNINNEILNDDYIFVPFQVESDSQIILHSRIKSMYQFVKIVSKQVKKFNESYNKDYKVIFKTHPHDFNLSTEKIYSLINEYDNIHLINGGDTEVLIKNSKLVITINSTVGIEALLNKKKVITLGEAFYNIDGIVDHCNDFEKLYYKINETLNKKFDEVLINNFLTYLRLRYFKEFYWNFPDDKSIELLADDVS